MKLPNPVRTMLQSRHTVPRFGFVIIVCLAVLSCSLDRRFLSPEVIPPQAKRGMVVNPAKHDTTYLLLEGPVWQPTFLNGSKTIQDLPYRVESSVFQSLSGNRLNAWLMRPTTHAENGITVLFLHGSGGNVTTEYLTMAPLVERGFRVMLFDYSGFGFSTGTASRKTLLADAQAALRHVRSIPDEQHQHLIVYGQSLGGYLAILLTASSNEHIDGLVTEGAFTDFDDIAAKSTGLGFLARVITKNGPSSKEEIQKVHVPTLVVHSTEDKTVPFSMGQELFDAANDPKDFFAVGGRHCGAPNLVPDSLCSRIDRLMKKHQ